MVAEDGELDEAESKPLAGVGEALLDGAKAAVASEVPHPDGDTQSHEDWCWPVE